MINRTNSRNRRSLAKRALAVALSAAALTVGLSSQADASPHAVTSGAPGTMVTTYEAVNIRQTPWSTSKKQGSYPANYTVFGICWAHGEPISDNGVVRNDVWVSTGVENGVHSFFISAVYLKGDSLGGMPVGAQCP
ncbi:hypothetical protein [Amycolatopsis sp. DSM 110486]|uniref:hypothetical protein n=1 Tax=Amycolatopsis sp. DSM 110486 TaxID=2865832 RepID=UPI001C6A57CF|nr:hypothetical protein [Amycolatopsis sp. DSM 110486]QYN17327.1 hypothetical protein K1T34_31460 [Amycolatopsis sp. DSM 110486]